MVTKEELRLEVMSLNSAVNTEKAKRINLENELESRTEERDRLLEENQKMKAALAAMAEPIIKDAVENEIRNHLSIRIDGGYGGYIDAELRYDGDQFSHSSTNINMSNNSLEY